MVFIMLMIFVFGDSTVLAYNILWRRGKGFLAKLMLLTNLHLNWMSKIIKRLIILLVIMLVCLVLMLLLLFFSFKAFILVMMSNILEFFLPPTCVDSQE